MPAYIKDAGGTYIDGNDALKNIITLTTPSDFFAKVNGVSTDKPVEIEVNKMCGGAPGL